MRNSTTKNKEKLLKREENAENNDTFKKTKVEKYEKNLHSGTTADDWMKLMKFNGTLLLIL